MTEKLKQSLSAVIDDEAEAFEVRRVLDELDRDPELAGLWDRYHIIGSALRGERTGAQAAMLPAAMRDRIWQALEPELAAGPGVPAAAAAVAGARSRLGRYTGLAVAASVAFAVVLGFNGLGGSEGTPELATTAEVTEPSRTLDVRNARVTLAPEVSPSDVQRAHAYMLHHAQQQGMNQAGVMSFVKMATYEAP